MPAHCPKDRLRRRLPRLTFEGLEPRVCLSSVTAGNYLFRPLVESAPISGSHPVVGADFKHVVANSSGVIAYTVADGRGQVSIQRTDGTTPTILFDGAGPLRVLDDQGLGIDGQGDVFFVGDFTDPTGVEHTALLSTHPGSGPQGFSLVADTTGHIAAGHPVEQIHAFQVNDAGSVVFSGPDAASPAELPSEGIFTATPSGSGYLISPVTDFDPTNLQVIGPGSGLQINSRTALAFLRPFSDHQGGLVLAHGSQLTTLATQDFALPVTPGAATFRGIYSYALSDQDTAVLAATKLDAQKPQNPSLYVASGGNLVTVLDGDADSPTYPVTTPDGVAINANNVVAFVGEGSDSAQAIYLTTDGTNLQRVIGHGDQIGDAQVVNVSLIDAHSLDDQGAITFKATLATGQAAVFRAMPTTGGTTPKSEAGDPITPLPGPVGGGSDTPADPGSSPSGKSMTVPISANPAPGVGATPVGSFSAAASGSTVPGGSTSAAAGSASNGGASDTSSPTSSKGKRHKAHAPSKKLRPTKEMLKSLAAQKPHKLSRREWKALN